MNFSASVYILLSVIISTLTRNNIVDARLIAYVANQTLVLPTSDYFLHHEPYYTRNGTGILWPFATNTTDCVFRTVDPTNKAVQTAARQAAPYPDLALFVYWSVASKAGCYTIAQVGKAIEQTSRELELANLPAVNLIVIMNFSNNTAPLWGPGTLVYRTVEPSKIPEGPPEIPLVLLDQWASLQFFQTYKPASQLTFRFMEKNEPGPWNELFLSTGYVAYQWIYFAIILALMTYTSVRFGRLVKLKMTPKSFRLAVFIIANINAIFLLVNIVMGAESFAGKLIQLIVSTIAVINFDLILVYWSVRGRAMFSFVTVIIFRAILIIHMIGLAICTVFLFKLSLSWQLDDDNVAANVAKYVMPHVALVSTIIFGIFAIWFAWCAYRVKKHSKACYRFIQLSIFSALAAVTYTLVTVQSYYGTFSAPREASVSLELTAVFYAFNYTIPLIRVIVCLCVLGLNWPMPKSTQRPRAVLSDNNAMHDDDIDAIESGWSSRFWQQIRAYFNSSDATPNTAKVAVNNNGAKMANNHYKNAHMGLSTNDTSAQEQSSFDVEHMGETMYVQTIVSTDNQPQPRSNPPQRHASIILSEAETVEIMPGTFSHSNTVTDVSVTPHH
ncbi:hypothetical protein BDF19DRAFT_444717 [Syncephalis fuscata]|nr:hypothetical protein BDF19DRAFT_444717 [Syncephalis fuscata]